MPRAKKPKTFSSKTNSIKITISDFREHLCECLGITEQTRCQEMMSYVEELLRDHLTIFQNGVPTPASRIVALERLQQPARALLEELATLDDYTRLVLRRQPEIDLKALQSALESLVNRITHKLKLLKPIRKQGRPCNTLPMLIPWLENAFFIYASDEKKRNKKTYKKALNEFIDWALQATNIPHPEPSKSMSRSVPHQKLATKTPSWEELDELSGIAYEEALAKLTPKQRREYLKDLKAR